jgi:hypothetical protein
LEHDFWNVPGIDRQQFVFFDFEQSAKAVFVEYIAMMGFSEWAERGSKAGNGCPCAKGSHTVVFLPGNFGGKDD